MMAASFLSQTQNFLPWLPGCGKLDAFSDFFEGTREIRSTEPVHPNVAGIDPYDLNYKKGVRGFFSEGILRALEYSEAIVEDQERKSNHLH